MSTGKGNFPMENSFIMTSFKVLLFSCILTSATCKQLNYFTELSKCSGSPLGDHAELPRAFMSTSDIKNTSDGTFPVHLTENHLQCESDKGRASSLTVSENSHNLNQILALFRSGYILHDKTYFSSDEYCVQDIYTRNGTVSISLRICEPRCSSTTNACVQKCCEPGKVWDLKDYLSEKVLACEPSGNTRWKPSLYEKEPNERLDAKHAHDVKVRFSAAHPRHFCDGGFFLMTLKEYNGMPASPFRILSNGKAVMKLGRNLWEEVPSGQYCVDGAMNFHHDNETSNHVSSQFSGSETDTVMLVCTEFMDDPEAEYEGTPNLLYVIAMLVASVFLFMTVVVYILLWNRQSVHGWTFLGYVISLLLTFIFLSTAHLSSGEYDCTLIGIACHFFFISCFSWLTALNFDVFWSFRSLNPYPGRKKEVLRFLRYSIFAIGTPACIVSVGLVLEKIYGDDPDSDVIVPRYGVTRCTMDRSADLPYLFGPISVLLGCNLILFPSTLYLVYKSQKMAQLTGMKNSMVKHKIRFFGKLFILAGVTWVFEVISWACTEPGKPVHWIWKFLDLVNILQAVAIFVVFVCNQKTLTELTEKFPRLKRISTIIEKASGGVTGGNSTRKQSNTVTQVSSSVCEAPGLDNVELR